MATSKTQMPGVADDEMPELTAKKLRTGRSFSELLDAKGIKRPGRPPSSDPKLRITIRLDADVIEHFKNRGPGWQTRLNEALVSVVEAEKHVAHQRPSRAAAAHAGRLAAKVELRAKRGAARKTHSPPSE